MVKRLIQGLLIWFLLAGIAHADVSEIVISVDKNPVVVQESFILTVEVAGNVSRDVYQPERWFDDFMVGRTSSSNRTSIINGRASASTTFRTVLTPQRPGTIAIQPIQIEGVTSNKIRLKVLEEGAPDATRSQREAFMTASIDQENVYLQQQFTYVAKLYLAANLSGGNITPPELEGADISQVGRDQESTEMVNGRRYRVYQRNFSVTPNRSGDFTIQGARFEGEVYDESVNRTFSSFAPTKPIATGAPAVEINVQSIPNDWQGTWLPSELVSLSREFDPADGTLQVGEPVTVTYMLTAVNVKVEQLPELPSINLPNVRSYPEQAELNSFTRNGVSIAQKTQQVTLIANQPGSLEIPRQTLAWFNTKTGHSERIELPAQRFEVEGILQDMGENGSFAEDNHAAEATGSETPLESSDTESSSVTTSSKTEFSWLWIGLTSLFAVLWLLTIFAWWSSRSRSRDTKSTSHDSIKEPKDKALWQDIQKASLANDAPAVRKHAMVWAKSTMAPAPNHFSELPQVLKQNHPQVANDLVNELKAEIAVLEQAMYAAEPEPWRRGKHFYQRLKSCVTVSSSAKTQKKAQALPELYRNS